MASIELYRTYVFFCKFSNDCIYQFFIYTIFWQLRHTNASAIPKAFSFHDETISNVCFMAKVVPRRKTIGTNAKSTKTQTAGVASVFSSLFSSLSFSVCYVFKSRICNVHLVSKYILLLQPPLRVCVANRNIYLFSLCSRRRKGQRIRRKRKREGG